MTKATNRMRTNRQRREAKRYWRAFWNNVSDVGMLAVFVLVAVPGAVGFGLLLGISASRSF